MKILCFPSLGRLLPVAVVLFWQGVADAAAPYDLPEIKAANVLRHSGILYANFVTSSNGGFDVEIVQRFAKHLGVNYQFQKTEWTNFVEQLTGKRYEYDTNDTPKQIGETAICADIAASGITILPKRQKVVAFSNRVFPTQVLLVTGMDSLLEQPPLGSLEDRIARTRSLMSNQLVLCKKDTCLDPKGLRLKEAGAIYRCFEGPLNALADAMLGHLPEVGGANMTVLDVPDVMVSMNSLNGAIKIVGPVNDRQYMAAAFRPDCPKLREAYNEFLHHIQTNGEYEAILTKHYPGANTYFADFFKEPKGAK